MMKWFFGLSDDGVVRLQARAEGDGMIGDARETVTAKQNFYGVSYVALRDAKSGVVEVNEAGKGRIV
jgi:hypothetical protein